MVSKTTATYDQVTGLFTIWAPIDGGNERAIYEAQGYSGRGACKNNPDCEHIRNEGPLPFGRYRIGIPFDHRRVGPLAFRLDRVDDGPTFGRSGFLIHGDNRANPGQASSGCIILSRPARDAIVAYKVGYLDVVRPPVPQSAEGED